MDKVRIGALDYKIILIDGPIVMDAKQVKGQISYDKHIITLDTTVQDEQGLRQTLLHEIVHGIVHERNITVDDEYIVDEIATGLYGLIRDNPALFKEEY